MPGPALSTRWRCRTSSAAPGPLSEHRPSLLPPSPAAGCAAAGTPREFPCVKQREGRGAAIPSLGKVSAAPLLVSVENSLGAMAKLQLWFGCGEVMAMAWGGRAGQGDSSDARQMRMQSSLGLLPVAAAGENAQAEAGRGETWRMCHGPSC